MWLCVTSRLGDIHLHTREKRERAKTCDDDSVFNEFPGSETYNHKLVKWQPGNVDHMLLWWRYFQKFKGSEVVSRWSMTHSFQFVCVVRSLWFLRFGCFTWTQHHCESHSTLFRNKHRSWICLSIHQLNWEIFVHEGY